MPRLWIMVIHVRCMIKANLRNTAKIEQRIFVSLAYFLNPMLLSGFPPALLKICEHIIGCRTINLRVQVVPWLSGTASVEFLGQNMKRRLLISNEQDKR